MHSGAPQCLVGVRRSRRHIQSYRTPPWRSARVVYTAGRIQITLAVSWGVSFSRARIWLRFLSKEDDPVSLPVFLSFAVSRSKLCCISSSSDFEAGCTHRAGDRILAGIKLYKSRNHRMYFLAFNKRLLLLDFLLPSTDGHCTGSLGRQFSLKRGQGLPAEGWIPYHLPKAGES